MSEVISKISDKLELPEEELGDELLEEPRELVSDSLVELASDSLDTLLVKIGSLNYCVMLIYFVLEIFDNNINSAKFITAGFFDIMSFKIFCASLVKSSSRALFFGFRSKFTIKFGINLAEPCINFFVKFIIKFIIDSVKLRSESRINIGNTCVKFIVKFSKDLVMK